HQEHLLGRPTLAARRPSWEEAGRGGRRPLDPGDRRSPAQPPRTLRRARRRLLLDPALGAGPHPSACRPARTSRPEGHPRTPRDASGLNSKRGYRRSRFSIPLSPVKSDDAVAPIIRTRTGRRVRATTRLPSASGEWWRPFATSTVNKSIASPRVAP